MIIEMKSTTVSGQWKVFAVIQRKTTMNKHGDTPGKLLCVFNHLIFVFCPFAVLNMQL